MRNIPIYFLSQSGMRFIRLLKQEVPCLVKEVQWSQVNVKNDASSSKKASSSNMDFIREVKSLHYATVKKETNSGYLQWSLQNFWSGFRTYQSTSGFSYRAFSMLYNKSYQLMRLLWFFFIYFSLLSLHVSGFYQPIIRGIFSCCLCATTWFM